MSAVITTPPVWLWVAFAGLVVVLLVADSMVLHRGVEEIPVRRAAIDSIGWITISLLFGLLVLVVLGDHAAGEYYAAYVTEKALSVDNVFVWSVILTHFTVPKQLQHRALFWGVSAALLLRLVFILAGVALLDRLDWLFYFFGAFLIFAAVKMLRDSDDEIDPEAGPVMRIAHRLVPSVPEFHGTSLFTRIDGRRVATQMFFVVVVIETTDLVFAVDSIPAVLALSTDRFVVLSSNAFAVLGLRSLYFLFADLHGRFRYLPQGLAMVLVFVGAKMLLAEGIGGWALEIPIATSLGVIVGVLVGAVVASIVFDGPEPEAAP